jgi:hypothetical protein
MPKTLGFVDLLTLLTSWTIVMEGSWDSVPFLIQWDEKGTLFSKPIL